MLAESRLPAVEGTAGVFSYVVKPFPLSVLVALCFLVNWRGYQGVVGRGLRTRFGRVGGFAIHGGLVEWADRVSSE